MNKEHQYALISYHIERARESYDSEADVLYINFKKPSHATDSELTDEDIIIRYEGETINYSWNYYFKCKQTLIMTTFLLIITTSPILW